MTTRRVVAVLAAAGGGLVPALAEAEAVPAATCPDSFSVCAPPDVTLGHLLVAVPAAGLLLFLVGAGVFLSRDLGAARFTRGIWVAMLLYIVPPAVSEFRIAPGAVVYYDEYLHGEATENLAARASPHPCCRFEEGRCIEGGPMLWPVATHIPAALLLLVRGDREVGAGLLARETFNRLASLAAPLLVFAWIMQLLGDAPSAVAAAIAWGCWPGARRLESSGDLMPGAILFLLLLLCAVELWRRRPGWPAAVAVCGLMALTFHSRLEMVWVTPWIVWRAGGVRGGRMIVLACWPIVVAPLVWLYREGAQHQTLGWNATIRGTVEFLRAHAPENALYFLKPTVASPVLVAFVLAGLLLPAGRRFVGLALTAGLFFAFDSAYHVGRYDPAYGFDGFRYALPVVVLLLPFVSLATAAVTRRLAGVGFAVVVMAIVLPVENHDDFLSATPANAALNEAMHDERERGVWRSGDVLVTRSVAFTRAMTGARNIVERCSLDDGARMLGTSVATRTTSGAGERRGPCRSAAGARNPSCRFRRHLTGRGRGCSSTSSVSGRAAGAPGSPCLDPRPRISERAPMRSRFLHGVIASFLAVAFLAASERPAFAADDWNGAQIKWRPYSEGLAEAKKKKKPVCLVFFTEWCPHCKNFRNVFSDPKVVAASKRFVMIHLDKDQNTELSAQYALDGEYIPRTFFLSSKGEVAADIHAPRDRFKYFYDEAQPADILAGMEKGVEVEVAEASAGQVVVIRSLPEDGPHRQPTTARYAPATPP